METPLILTKEFWSDGGVLVAESERTNEGSSLAEFAQRELQAKDWCFFQTSGSGGKRKWVGLTKESLLISARAVNAHFDITEHDHWLLALPTHHVGGFGVLARAFLSRSQVSKIDGKWDAATFVHRCEESGVTLASLVPTQVFDLVAGKLAAPKTMRVVLVGGGAMSVEVEQAAQALGWPVRRTYGMTETASQVASQRTAGGEMEVLPIWVVSTDADGLLMVRGEALAQGYAVHENEKWRWEPIPAATGLRTRDRVSLQWENGWCSLRFIGRESGIVKILGELVALGPIQSWIDDLRLKLGLYAGEAVVCDIPDTRKEAKLALAVSGMSPAEAARLQKSLNEMLRPLEQIEDVWMLTSIARGELDKVRLEELRRQLTLPSEQSHPTV